jgi:sorbitol/mannitol transport system substrate-binding protein
MTDKDNEIYGICLRGKAGWGENMAFLTTVANSFGARWFDEDWTPQFDSPQWKETLSFYNDLLNNYGPPGASTNGFNENLSLFQQGKCGMWIDATVAASFVTNPDDSTVADKVGFALAPDTGLGKRGNWLWAWALAIPAGTQKEAAAKQFIEWATSKEYLALVAENEGWANVPPGSRTSLYENPEYLKGSVRQDDAGRSTRPIRTIRPSTRCPMSASSIVAIPEWAGIGTPPVRSSRLWSPVSRPRRSAGKGAGLTPTRWKPQATRGTSLTGRAASLPPSGSSPFPVTFKIRA